jgi:hypothetical protein
MVVVTSVEPGNLSQGLLAEYLRWSAQPPRPTVSATPPRGWVGDLASAIEAYRVPVVARYPVAGYTVDLAVGAGADAVGVECVVFERDPGRHLERHQALVRAGWQLRDAFRSRWLASPESAVTTLVTELLERQLEPTGPALGAGQ